MSIFSEISTISRQSNPLDAKSHESQARASIVALASLIHLRLTMCNPRWRFHFAFRWPITSNHWAPSKQLPAEFQSRSAIWQTRRRSQANRSKKANTKMLSNLATRYTLAKSKHMFDLIHVFLFGIFIQLACPFKRTRTICHVDCQQNESVQRFDAFQIHQNALHLNLLYSFYHSFYTKWLILALLVLCRAFWLRLRVILASQSLMFRFLSSYQLWCFHSVAICGADSRMET